MGQEGELDQHRHRQHPETKLPNILDRKSMARNIGRVMK